jgi:nitrite reductase/ring-hydroxylating ferredoxin subunit
MASAAAAGDMIVDGNMRGMADSGEWRCATSELAPGRTLKFRLDCRGRRIEGFVVNHGGAVRAWINACPHVGTPLDLWPNEFYSEDGRTLVCSTHGAVFEPVSGYCIAGPCATDALRPLPVRREAGALVVSCPG